MRAGCSLRVILDREDRVRSGTNALNCLVIEIYMGDFHIGREGVPISSKAVIL